MRRSRGRSFIFAAAEMASGDWPIGVGRGGGEEMNDSAADVIVDVRLSLVEVVSVDGAAPLLPPMLAVEEVVVWEDSEGTSETQESRSRASSMLATMARATPPVRARPMSAASPPRDSTSCIT